MDPCSSHSIFRALVSVGTADAACTSVLDAVSEVMPESSDPWERPELMEVWVFSLSRSYVVCSFLKE